MRNITLISCLLFIFTFSKAQEKEPLKPEKGTFSTYLLLNNIGISAINISPPSNILFTGSFINTVYPVFSLKYYFKPTLCVRGYIGYGNNKSENQFSDSIMPTNSLNYYDENGAVKYYNLSSLFSGEKALHTSDASNFFQSFNIGAGIEKHFNMSRRFDPYIAADLIFNKSTMPVSHNMLDYSSASHTVEYTNDLKGQSNQNLVSANARVTAGMNYFICKYFSVGAEFGLGYFYSVNRNKFTGHNKLVVDGKTITDNDIEGHEFKTTATATELVMDTPNNNLNNNFALRLNFYFNKHFVE
jgi:hypothetical protein